MPANEQESHFLDKGTYESQHLCSCHSQETPCTVFSIDGMGQNSIWDSSCIFDMQKSVSHPYWHLARRSEITNPATCCSPGTRVHHAPSLQPER